MKTASFLTQLCTLRDGGGIRRCVCIWLVAASRASLPLPTPTLLLFLCAGADDGAAQRTLHADLAEIVADVSGGLTVLPV